MGVAAITCAIFYTFGNSHRYMLHGLGTVFHLWHSAFSHVKIGVVSTSVVCYKVGASICHVNRTQAMEAILMKSPGTTHTLNSTHGIAGGGEGVS